MIRILRMRCPAYLGALPAIFQSYDEPDKSSEYFNQNENETGMDRLERMFTLNAYKEPSRELVTILQGATAGGIVGLFVGGFLGSQHTASNFMDQNMATQFKSQSDAKKQLQSKVVLAFGQGAFRWCLRMSAFSFIFIGTSTVISVYRGESSVWEYIIAGMATGGILRMWLGLRAMTVGAGLGGTLGVIAGILTLSFLKATGTTMEEVRMWQYDWRKWRKDKYYDIINKYKAKEEEKEIKALFSTIDDRVQKPT